MSGPSPKATLVCEPIGVIRTPFGDRVSAPRQARCATEVIATIELHPGKGFEFAVEDLDGWEYLWIVFWFHLNTDWRPKVLPPRSDRRRGVFSTRSPHRPNPIGMSVVELVGVEGLVIHVRGADMVDGTPVLDVKPYVPYTDSIPHARTGWLADPAASVALAPIPTGASAGADASGGASASGGAGESADASAMGRPWDPIAHYRVEILPEAREQLDWLAARGGQMEGPLVTVLALGPTPHPYRRIRPTATGFRIAIHEWRADFSVKGRTVSVEQILSGYKPQQLARDDGPTLDLHRRFVAAFGRR